MSKSKKRDALCKQCHVKLLQMNSVESVYKVQIFVIPASETRRESFFVNDSGQAGMTVEKNVSS